MLVKGALEYKLDKSVKIATIGVGQYTNLSSSLRGDNKNSESIPLI